MKIRNLIEIYYLFLFCSEFIIIQNRNAKCVTAGQNDRK